MLCYTSGCCFQTLAYAVVNRSVNPDECVANRSAVQGDVLRGGTTKETQNILILDVTPLSLGLFIIALTLAMALALAAALAVALAVALALAAALAVALAGALVVVEDEESFISAFK